ncbi:hypothetical protein WAI453_011599 [Rhynchosporium graminicola]
MFWLQIPMPGCSLRQRGSAIYFSVYSRVDEMDCCSDIAFTLTYIYKGNRLLTTLAHKLRYCGDCSSQCYIRAQCSRILLAVTITSLSNSGESSSTITGQHWNSMSTSDILSRWLSFDQAAISIETSKPQNEASITKNHMLNHR